MTIIRHKTKGSVAAGVTKKIPDPAPVVTKWFIVRKENHERYDGREFDTVDDAHKAQDELGDDKKRTYIDSHNIQVGNKKLLT